MSSVSGTAPAGPPPARPIWMWVSNLAALATHLLAALIVLVFLASIVPIYHDFYAAVNWSLPVVTLQVFSLSYFVTDYWYLLLPAASIIECMIAFGTTYLPQRLRWIRAVWFGGFLIAALLLLFWGSLVLSIPFEAIKAEENPLLQETPAAAQTDREAVL